MQQQQQHEEQLSIQQPSSSNGVPAVAPKQKADTGWYYAVGLSAMAALICSVDRAAISVAILPMSEQYGWSDSTKGAINRCLWSPCVIQREHLTEGASLGAGQGVQYDMSRTERALSYHVQSPGWVCHNVPFHLGGKQALQPWRHASSSLTLPCINKD